MIRDRETLNVLLDGIRRFVRDRLMPNEDIVAESDEIPSDIISEMKGMGLFGLTIPESYGGLGLTMEEEVLAMLELGRAFCRLPLAARHESGSGRRGSCSTERKSRGAAICRDSPTRS